MSEFDLGVEGIQLGLAFVALAVAYLVVWRRTRLDSYRQDLFTIRDELWDYARARGLLNSPAHREMRNYANTFIRAAHLTNLAILVPSALLSHKGDGRPTPRQLIDQLPNPDDQTVLKGLLSRLANRFLLHVMLGSLLGLTVSGLIAFGFVLWGVGLWCKRGLRRFGIEAVQRRLESLRTKVMIRAAAGTEEIEEYELSRHRELTAV